MKWWGVPLAVALSAGSVSVSAAGLRVIAIDAKLDVARMEAPDALETETERLMLAASDKFSAKTPNLVVFPEFWAAESALAGSDHASARQALGAQAIWGSLLGAHFAELAWLRAAMGLDDSHALGYVLADRLYRPMIRAFSTAARRHHAWVIGCTVVGDVQGGLRRNQSLRSWPDSSVGAQASNLNSAAFVFDDQGRYVGNSRRRSALPQPLGYALPAAPVEVFELPFGTIGVALGDDLDSPATLERLARAGCQVLVAPGAHPGDWPMTTHRGVWRPQAQLATLMAPLQATSSIRYVVAPTLKGMIGDLMFDGQGAIAARSHDALSAGFLATEGGALHGKLLALAPWVVADPLTEHSAAGPALSLQDRRDYLEKVSHTLAPGRARAGQTREAILAADLELSP